MSLDMGPGFWVLGQNYALQFAGGNTNSLQEEGDFADGALRFYSNGAAVANIANTILYDQVQHIAIVDTGSALQIYRNGELVGSANATWNVHPTNAARPTVQIGFGRPLSGN